MPRALGSLYSLYTNGEPQPSYDSLLATLRQMMEQFEELHVIRDALDECLERQELVIGIQELIGWKCINLYILFTSRRERDIEEIMEPFDGS